MGHDDIEEILPRQTRGKEKTESKSDVELRFRSFQKWFETLTPQTRPTLLYRAVKKELSSFTASNVSGKSYPTLSTNIASLALARGAPLGQWFNLAVAEGGWVPLRQTRVITSTRTMVQYVTNQGKRPRTWMAHDFPFGSGEIMYCVLDPADPPPESWPTLAAKRQRTGGV